MRSDFFSKKRSFVFKIYTYIHSNMHTSINTPIPIYISTYIHTYIHTYIRTATFEEVCCHLQLLLDWEVDSYFHYTLDWKKMYVCPAHDDASDETRPRGRSG